MNRLFPLLCCLLVALGVTACGEENKVGSDKILDFKEKTNERLGVTTTTATTAPSTETTAAAGKAAVGAAPPSTTTTAPPSTTAAPTTTAAPKVQAFEISINGDNSGASQFDPSSARVFQGTLIRFVNKDSVARSVEEDRGVFKSGSIPPGGTFDYVANTPGKFNISDGTRPYAVGVIEVVPR